MYRIYPKTLFFGFEWLNTLMKLIVSFLWLFKCFKCVSFFHIVMIIIIHYIQFTLKPHLASVYIYTIFKQNKPLLSFIFTQNLLIHQCSSIYNIKGVILALFSVRDSILGFGQQHHKNSNVTSTLIVAQRKHYCSVFGGKRCSKTLF